MPPTLRGVSDDPGALRPVGQCPVCGGTDREPAAAMSKGGVQYLRHAAARLGMPVEQLIESARVFRCLGCGSVFCDPWLSAELASWLFCAASPDHIAGWGELEFWLRDREGRFGRRNERLYAAVTRRTGPVRSYAEFGCPFQGFLLQLKACETDAAARLRLFSQALDRGPDVRWSRITRLYNALESVLRRLLLLVLRIRALADRMSGARPAFTAPEHGHALPERRYLLTHDTTNGWGSNCVRYGGSCRYFARTLLDAHVLPVEEAARLEAGAFDLVGVFNSLDHTMSPADVLGKVMNIGKHVLVVSHSARQAGKQHLYAFADDFKGWVSRSFGVSVEDLGDEVDPEGRRDYSYLLFSRTPAGRSAVQS